MITTLLQKPSITIQNDDLGRFMTFYDMLMGQNPGTHWYLGSLGSLSHNSWLMDSYAPKSSKQPGLGVLHSWPQHCSSRQAEIGPKDLGSRKQSEKFNWKTWKKHGKPWITWITFGKKRETSGETVENNWKNIENSLGSNWKNKEIDGHKTCFCQQKWTKTLGMFFSWFLALNHWINNAGSLNQG